MGCVGGDVRRDDGASQGYPVRGAVRRRQRGGVVPREGAGRDARGDEGSVHRPRQLCHAEGLQAEAPRFFVLRLLGSGQVRCVALYVCVFLCLSLLVYSSILERVLDSVCVCVLFFRGDVVCGVCVCMLRCTVAYHVSWWVCWRGVSLRPEACPVSAWPAPLRMSSILVMVNGRAVGDLSARRCVFVLRSAVAAVVVV